MTLNPTGIPIYNTDNDDPDFNPNESSTDKLVLKWKKGLKHIERFWKIWREDYLMSLRERTQTRLAGPKKRSPTQAQIGDVVLIKDDLPRENWSIGKITELITSFDKQIRAARVLLASQRTISRPLCLLYPSECSDGTDRDNVTTDDGNNDIQAADNSEDRIRTRPTRAAAQRAIPAGT